MKRSPRFTIVKLAIFGIAYCTGSTWAQVKFPIERPVSKVGSVWKYRTVDLWNNKELSTSEVELVQIESDRLTYRAKNSLRADAITTVTTADLNPCRSLRNSNQEVCTGSLRFPIELGSKLRYEKLPWQNGAGYNSGTCEVTGEEKITVPAGDFHTVKVECSGFWTRVFDGSDSGKFFEVVWYAPSVGRAAKLRYVDHKSSGGVFNKTETELTAVPEK